MLHPRSGLPLFCAAGLAALILGAAGCIFDPKPDPIIEPPPPIQISRSRPDSLLIGLEAIYNDKEHSAIERLNAYESLFLRPVVEPPQQGFIFNFQPADIANGLPPSWGLDSELEAHNGLFNAQQNGEIYLLELRITRGAIEDDPEHTGWKEIFASNVYLRLMFNPNDGLEVNGGQAEFDFAPDTALPGWWIGEWTDLPRQ